MADRKLSVSLLFISDTKKAKAEIKDLQKSLNDLSLGKNTNKSLLTLEIKSATDAATKLEIALNSAVNVNTGKLDLSKFQESLKASNMSLADYLRELLNLGPDGERTFRQLALAITSAEVPLKRTNSILKDFGQTLSNTVKWLISSSAIHGFMGAILSAYGYALDLNESLNKILIVTGHNIDYMTKFALEANKAAQSLSTTTTRYTDAALIYYQQGLSDKEVKERTDITMKMANAAGESAQVISLQLTAVWNNFAKGGENLEHFADVMTKLGAETASSTSEIADGLEKFAAIADTVGLSYEYAASALATVTATTRQSADVVGTAFKTLFARIQGLNLGETLEDGVDLNKYSQALEKVGVDVLDANGKLIAMDDILDRLGERWGELTNALQVALAETVAGTRQYSQLMALMGNWDFFQLNLDRAKNSDGALQQLADIYASSWEAALNRVRAAAEGIYKSLINDLFFIDFSKGFEKALNGVNLFIKGIGGIRGVLTSLSSFALSIFGDKISAAISNTAYNIRMSFKSVQDRMILMKENVNLLVNNYYSDIDISEEGTSRRFADAIKAATAELIAYIRNADKMTEAERHINEKIIERHSLMVSNIEQLTIELAELEKERTRSTAMFEHGISNITDALFKVDPDPQGIKILAEMQAKMLALKSEFETTNLQVTEFSTLSQVAAAGVDHFKDKTTDGSKALEYLDLLLKDNGIDINNMSTEAKNKFSDIEDIFKKVANGGCTVSEAIDLLNGKVIELDFDTAQLRKTMDGQIELIDKIIDANINDEATRKTLHEITAKLSQSNKNYADALDKVNKIQGNLKAGTDAHIKKLAETEKSYLKGSDAVVAFGRSITSGITIINSIDSIIKTWTDDEADLSTQIMSTASAVGMLIPMVVTFFTTLNSLNPILAIFSGALIAAAGVIKLVSTIVEINDSYTKYLNNVKESAEKSAEALENVLNKYNNIIESFDKYLNIVNALDKCTKGSKEWYELLEDIDVLNLLLLKDFPKLQLYGFEWNEKLLRWTVSLTSIEDFLKELQLNTSMTTVANSLATAVLSGTDAILDDIYTGWYNIADDAFLAVQSMYGFTVDIDDFAEQLGFDKTDKEYYKKIYDFSLLALDNANQWLLNDEREGIGNFINQALDQEDFNAEMLDSVRLFNKFLSELTNIKYYSTYNSESEAMESANKLVQTLNQNTLTKYDTVDSNPETYLNKAAEEIIKEELNKGSDYLLKTYPDYITSYFEGLAEHDWNDKFSKIGYSFSLDYFNKKVEDFQKNGMSDDILLNLLSDDEKKYNEIYILLNKLLGISTDENEVYQYILDILGDDKSLYNSYEELLHIMFNRPKMKDVQYGGLLYEALNLSDFGNIQNINAIDMSQITDEMLDSLYRLLGIYNYLDDDEQNDEIDLKSKNIIELAQLYGMKAGELITSTGENIIDLAIDAYVKLLLDAINNGSWDDVIQTMYDLSEFNWKDVLKANITTETEEVLKRAKTMAEGATLTLLPLPYTQTEIHDLKQDERNEYNNNTANNFQFDNNIEERALERFNSIIALGYAEALNLLIDSDLITFDPDVLMGAADEFRSKYIGENYLLNEEFFGLLDDLLFEFDDIEALAERYVSIFHNGSNGQYNPIDLEITYNDSEGGKLIIDLSKQNDDVMNFLYFAYVGSKFKDEAGDYNLEAFLNSLTDNKYSQLLEEVKTTVDDTDKKTQETAETLVLMYLTGSDFSKLSLKQLLEQKSLVEQMEDSLEKNDLLKTINEVERKINKNVLELFKDRNISVDALEPLNKFYDKLYKGDDKKQFLTYLEQILSLTSDEELAGALNAFLNTDWSTVKDTDELFNILGIDLEKAGINLDDFLKKVKEFNNVPIAYEQLKQTLYDMNTVLSKLKTGDIISDEDYDKITNLVKDKNLLKYFLYTGDGYLFYGEKEAINGIKQAGLTTGVENLVAAYNQYKLLDFYTKNGVFDVETGKFNYGADYDLDEFKLILVQLGYLQEEDQEITREVAANVVEYSSLAMNNPITEELLLAGEQALVTSAESLELLQNIILTVDESYGSEYFDPQRYDTYYRYLGAKQAQEDSKNGVGYYNKDRYNLEGVNENYLRAAILGSMSVVGLRDINTMYDIYANLIDQPTPPNPTGMTGEEMQAAIDEYNNSVYVTLQTAKKEAIERNIKAISNVEDLKYALEQGYINQLTDLDNIDLIITSVLNNINKIEDTEELTTLLQLYGIALSETKGNIYQIVAERVYKDIATLEDAEAFKNAFEDKIDETTFQTEWLSIAENLAEKVKSLEDLHLYEQLFGNGKIDENIFTEKIQDIVNTLIDKIKTVADYLDLLKDENVDLTPELKLQLDESIGKSVKGMDNVADLASTIQADGVGKGQSSDLMKEALNNNLGDVKYLGQLEAFKEMLTFGDFKEVTLNWGIESIKNLETYELIKHTLEECHLLLQEINVIADNDRRQEVIENLSAAIIGSVDNLKDLNLAFEDGYVTVVDFTEKYRELERARDLKGIDEDEMDSYAKYLQEIAKESNELADSLEEDSLAAEIVSKSVMKMNSGVDKLSTNLENCVDVINHSTRESLEYSLAVDTLRDAMGDLLDINGDYLSSQFLTNAENLELMALAATGSAEAIDALRAAALQDVVLTIATQNGLVDEETGTYSLLDDVLHLQELLNAMGPIEVGANINLDQVATGEKEFIDYCNQMIQNAGLSVDLVNALFDSMGYEVQYETKEIPQEMKGRAVIHEVQELEPAIVKEEGQRPVGMAPGGTEMLYEPYTIERKVPRYAEKTYPGEEYTYTGYAEAIAMEASPDGKETPKIVGITRKADGAMNNYSARNAGGPAPKGTKTSSPKSSKGSSPKSPKGSSGGGKKDTKEKKDFEDELDRYHVILAQIDDQKRKLDELGKAKDRAYGKQKIDNMNKEIKAQKELNNKTQQYIDEIKDYLKVDKDAMSPYGAIFDADGNITNYEDIMKQQLAIYNAAVDAYNASAQEEADKKRLEDAEKAYETFKEKLKQYEETNNLLQEQEVELQEGLKKVYDDVTAKNEYIIDLKINVNDNELDFLDYLQDKIDNFNDGINEASEKLANLNDETGALLDRSDIHNEGISRTLGHYLIDQLGKSEEDAAALIEKFKTGTLTDEDMNLFAGIPEAEMQKVQDYKKDLLDDNKKLMDNMQEVVDTVNDSFKQISEDLDDAMKDIDRSTDALEHYGNMIDIVGADFLGVTTDIANALDQAEVDVANEKVAATRAKLDALKDDYAEAEKLYQDALDNNDAILAEKWKNALKEMDDEVNDATQDFHQAWEDALRSAQEALEAMLDRVKNDALDAIAGNVPYSQLADLMDQQEKVDDRFLDEYEQIYEMSKLNRDINNSIGDADNIKAKEALRDLQKEINKLQEDGNEMSQYDLDNARRKYELKLAELELENAINIKDTVRLSKDSEGNWSYIYTADEEKVALAELNYEDKLYAMQKANEEYINNIENELAGVHEEMLNKIAEIQADLTLTEEQKAQLIQQTYDFYTELASYYTGELGKAIDNNKELYDIDWTNYSARTRKQKIGEDDLTEYIADNYGYRLGNLDNYITDFNNTMLSDITGFDTLDGFEQNAQAATESAVAAMNAAHDLWAENTETTMQLAGTSVNAFAEDMMNDVDQTIVPKAIEAKDAVVDLANASVDEFGKLLGQAQTWQDTYSTLMQGIIDKNELVIQSINGVDEAISKLEESEDENVLGQDTTNKISESANAGAEAAATAAAAAQAGANQAAANAAQWARVMQVYNLINSGAVGNHDTGRVQNLLNRGYSSNEASLGQQLINMVYDVALGGRGMSMDAAKAALGFDSGGYTGDWSGANGRLALLHQKEIVLNESDTKNLLNAVDMVRLIANSIDLNAKATEFNLGNLSAAVGMLGAHSSVDLNVTITAEFPNVTDRNEIAEALKTLVNEASQYANRK